VLINLTRNFTGRSDAVVAIVAARAMLRNRKPGPRGDAHPRQHYPNKRPCWETAVASEMGQSTKSLRDSPPMAGAYPRAQSPG